jgi:hypothetical protein
MMDASVQDLFYLPFEEAGGGDTQVYLGTIGNTWTLSPTLILDGNAGFNIMKHESQGPDFGRNFGTDVFGIPGLNEQGLTGNSATVPERHSGMPVFETGLGILGNNATWTPVVRDERSYTASINLTKVAGRHEIRTGFDFVRLELTHWQPEIGNPRGALTFGGGLTGTPGYAGVGGWNSYAGFLLGNFSSYSKSVQFEEMPAVRTSSVCTCPIAGRSTRSSPSTSACGTRTIRCSSVPTAASSCWTSTRSTWPSAALAATRRTSG